MPLADHIFRRGNASMVIAGAAGAIAAVLTLRGMWQTLGAADFFGFRISIIALTLLGFGSGVLLLELYGWLFKKSASKRKRDSVTLPESITKSFNDATESLERVKRKQGSSPESRVESKSSLLWAVIAGVSLLIAVLSCGSLAFVWLNDSDKEGAYATKNEIQQFTVDLNKKLTYLSVTDTHNIVTLLNGDGSRSDPPTAQYLVSVQDKYVGQISIFRATEYIMSSDPLKIDASVRNLCGTIDKTLEEQDEILQALQNTQTKINLSMSFWGVLDAGIELNPPKAMLVELASILRALTGLKVRKVEVLIKGYADGQRNIWSAHLLPDPYHYDVVNVYPRAESDRIDSFQFIKIEKPKRIEDNYSNKDLPELRARFVRENFIAKFLESCGTAETEGHILEGYADTSSVIYEPDRKAQIFINIY